jgi:predicted kinase
MVVIVICGPIASGKSTVARAVARLLEAQRTETAAIDLDLVYEMLEHDGAPFKNNHAMWVRARRAAAALTDALLEDGVDVVIVEGDFLSHQERDEFLTALRSPIAPLYVTVHVSIDVALQRVQADATRGISRDPGFLRRHYRQLEHVLRDRPETDLVVDTESVNPEEAARVIAEWAVGADRT